MAQLESFTAVSRDRLLETSVNLRDVAERPVGGLGELRRPALSAAADQSAATPLPFDLEPAGGNDLPPIRPATVNEQPPAPASTLATPSHGTVQPRQSTSASPAPGAKPESVAPSADLFGDDITAEVPAIGHETPRPTMKFIDDELS